MNSISRAIASATGDRSNRGVDADAIARAAAAQWPSVAGSMTEEEAKSRLDSMGLQPWQLDLAKGIARSIGPSLGIKF